MNKNIYLAPSAVVTGDVILGENVNIWHGAVLRGDSGTITVGDNTNIQEHCVLHEQTTVGSGCTVGHGAILHGCTLKDNCLVGMGAIILDGAVVEENCLVGAGALVTGKTHAPAGSLLLGNPAKAVRSLSPEQIEENRESARHYVALAQAAFGEGVL